MNQEALLSLFNSFAFVEPKLVKFKDLCNGIAILQLLDHLYSIFIRVVYSWISNWREW